MNSLAADPIYTQDAVVANGGTNSSSVDLNGHVLIGIATPADLTSTSGELQTSIDNETWLPIYDREGNQFTLELAASRFIAIPPGDIAGLHNVRIVVGSAEGAERTLKLVCRKLGCPDP